MRNKLFILGQSCSPKFFDLRQWFARGRRPVYAIDLPGFGQPDRSDRFCSVRMMTDAALLALSELRRIHSSPADAIALSLSCEFLARAAVEGPDIVMTLGFISPTGFEGVARDAQGGTRGKKWLHGILKFPLWRRTLFRMLTKKAVIRKFLEKTWGAISTRLFSITIIKLPTRPEQSSLHPTSSRDISSVETPHHLPDAYTFCLDGPRDEG